MPPSGSVHSESLIWHLEGTPAAYSKTPANSQDSFRSRLAHKKSRTGCLACKTKKLKCDEQQPKCGRCAERREQCEYPRQKHASFLPSSTSIVPGRVLVSKPTGLMNLGISYRPITISILRQVLNISIPDECICPATHMQDNFILKALQHFDFVASNTLGSLSTYCNSQQRAPPLYSNYSFLLNAVMAFSVAHIHHLDPTNTNYWRATTCFGMRSAQLFQEAMHGDMSAHNLDGLLMTCHILGALAFYMQNSAMTSSMILSADPNSANWLFVLSGFKVFTRDERFYPYISSSIYRPFIEDLSLNNGNISTPSTSKPSELYQQFANLCDINEHSTIENNPYLAAILVAIDILHLQPNAATYFSILSFPARMTEEYAGLVRTKDPRSLLILSYWLAKMCGMEYWWCRLRAKVECQAICTYLEEWPDRRIQDLLQFPKRVASNSL